MLLISSFCNNYNITHIFSSPRHPKTNGVVKASHKEMHKNIIIYYNQNPDNFDFKNALLQTISVINNNNIHIINQYQPVDLLNNTDFETHKKVIENIYRKLYIPKKIILLK